MDGQVSIKEVYSGFVLTISNPELDAPSLTPALLVLGQCIEPHKQRDIIGVQIFNSKSHTNVNWTRKDIYIDSE